MREVFCEKLQKQAPGLERVPYPGELGQKVFDHISQEAWGQWMEHQTILINENRLMLHDPQTRAYLEAEMAKFFFGEEN